jgi:hypothetical protein
VYLTISGIILTILESGITAKFDYPEIPHCKMIPEIPGILQNFRQILNTLEYPEHRTWIPEIP